MLHSGLLHVLHVTGGGVQQESKDPPECPFSFFFKTNCKNLDEGAISKMVNVNFYWPDSLSDFVTLQEGWNLNKIEGI